jgi:hypothetical protein
VPEGVVVALEAVEVEEIEHRRVFLSRALALVLEVHLHAAAVAEPRQ